MTSTLQPAARPVRRRPPPASVLGVLGATAWIAGFSFSFLSADVVPLGFRDKWLGPILLSVAVIVAQARLVGAMRRFINPGMLLILAWVVLGALWAPRPVFVLTQSIAIIGVSLMGLGFCLSGWHPERFERDMAATIAVILIASIIVANVDPALGVHSGTDLSLRDSWRGVTWQKNALGQLSAVGLILWTYLWAARRLGGGWTLLGLFLSTFALIKSRSSTSLLLAMISCGIVIMILRPPVATARSIRRAVLWTCIVVVPVVIYLAVATPYLGFIGQFFGKDGTFSGRTGVWNALIAEIKTRPWLGTGLSSFWDGADPGEARVQAAVGWKVRNGHNGYIDVANELGVIGLLLFMSFLAWYCVALARLSRISRRHYALHMPLFAYLVLANTSESGWFFAIAPTHLIGMFASMEVSRLLFQHWLQTRLAQRQSNAVVAQGTGTLSTAPAPQLRATDPS